MAWFTPKRTTKRSARPMMIVEQLEDRMVPATLVDLTTAGSQGTINGAIFSQSNQGSSGTGNLDSFVRLQTNSTTDSGYNSDYRPVQLSENSTASYTHSIKVGSVPVQTINGVNYRKFLLDI